MNYTPLPDQKVDPLQVPAYAVEGALPYPAAARSRLRTCAARVLKVCGLAALVVLCHLVVDKVGTRRGAPDVRGRASLGSWPDLPPDVQYRRCAASSEWESVETSAPYASAITLQLSSTADLLFFLSRGPAAGSVQIVQTDAVGTEISVTTVAEYNQGGALEETVVCTVDYAEVAAGDGFAVLARNDPPADLKMSWSVRVELPAAAGGAPLELGAFSTDMPVFEHQVGDLAQTVHFQALYLSTADKPISVQSLSAVVADVANANAAISGSFNASAALTLTSTNAPINAAVGLVHDGGEGAATELTMSNANAAIDAAVYLYSARPDHTGGEFTVAGTSSAGPVTIGFPVAPVDSTLAVAARTRLAPASVSLHRTYEGAFALATLLGGVALSVDRDATDPAGEGRARAVDVTAQTEARLEGSVEWVAATCGGVRAAGAVEVTTTLGAATLNL